MKDQITLSLKATLGEEQPDGAREADLEIAFRGTISDVATLILGACEKHKQVKAAIIIAAQYLQDVENVSLADIMLEQIANPPTDDTDEIPHHNFNAGNKYDA